MWEIILSAVYLYGNLKGIQNSLVIIDDLMSECSKDQRISNLFTSGSHHQGISVMYLTQNLFPPGKQSRTISLNSHYMIAFKNPRDSLVVSTLARQMYPNNYNFLLESYQDATKKPYGYLFWICINAHLKILDCEQISYPMSVRLYTLNVQKRISYLC